MNTAHLSKIIIALSFFCFSVVSLAGEISASEQPSPEIACRYEMKIIPHAKSKASSKNAWFFWRQSGTVQTLDANGHYGEIWQRTPTDNIQYRKLYHTDKTAVEYMPADNPTNNINFDWGKLASMLSQQELDALKPIKKTQVMGRPAELRKGKLDDQTIEVTWLTNENLPARIFRKDKNRTVEVRLLEITPLSMARRKPIALEEIADYRHIDAIDFGDMENDPFVKKVLAGEGHHH
ncbi:MAG: hypothetical protein NTV00_09205 [Methylococcales bacterium]|nr:hypothetical protein [Methylococcales bacterium]